MTAEEVEIDLRILLMEINHTIERQIQMRIIDRETTLIAIGVIATVDLQVRVGVVIIGELAHMGFDVTGEHPLLKLPFGRHIKRDCGQLRRIE